MEKLQHGVSGPDQYPFSSDILFWKYFVKKFSLKGKSFCENIQPHMQINKTANILNHSVGAKKLHMFHFSNRSVANFFLITSSFFVKNFCLKY